MDGNTVDLEAENQNLSNMNDEEMISSEDMPDFEMGGNSFDGEMDCIDETSNEDSMLDFEGNDDFTYDPFAKTDDETTIKEEKPESEYDEYGLETITATINSDSTAFNDFESTKEIIRMAEENDDAYGRNLTSFDTDLIQQLGLSFVQENKVAKSNNMIIDGFRIVVEEAKKAKRNNATQLQAIAENTEVNAEEVHLKKVREYKNVTPKMKINYGSQQEQEDGFSMKKLGIAVVLAVVLGIFMGCKANSYYLDAIANNTKTTPLGCAFGWLLKDVPFKPFPVVSDIFATGFFSGVLIFGVIALFYFLEDEQKRKMRIGHEQGSSHLCTPSEFKQYRSKFMD